MATDFFRFPHTPHLAWLGTGKPRRDKVLDAGERAELLAAEVTVEEKIDGANVGISVDAHGQVRVQNRGQYIQRGGHPQFGPLWPWLAAHAELGEQLGTNLILFGEWCFAVHSVVYDQLPDWFLGFDVYDRQTETFWSTSRRDQLFERVSVTAVPELLRGQATLDELVELLTTSTSRVGTAGMEGLYVRRESADALVARAKLVRPEFVQQIDEHWSRRQLVANRLRR
jgi:hypothetical protein